VVVVTSYFLQFTWLWLVFDLNGRLKFVQFIIPSDLGIIEL